MLTPPTGVLFESYKHSSAIHRQAKPDQVTLTCIPLKIPLTTPKPRIPIMAPVLDFSMNDLNYFLF